MGATGPGRTAAKVGKPAAPVGRTLTLGAATEVEVAVTAFAPLLELLEAVPDPRRAEGKVYRLPHVLLFSILAIVSGGNSYRSVATFIDAHRRHLNRTFGLTWRRGAHLDPKHPAGPRQRRPRDRLPPPCRPVAYGLCQAERSQPGDRWQDAARQLRPVPRPRRRASARRLRHRHRVGAGAQRH